MPKQGQRAEINTFVQGLITEAGPLTFPHNASIDEDNFELHADGTRDRRLGMDYEVPGVFHNSLRSASEITSLDSLNTFTWTSVNSIVGLDFIVCQARRVLHIYDVNVPSIALSRKTSLFIGQEGDPETAFSFAAIDGKLIIAAGTPDIFYVSYNQVNDTFSIATTRLKVRDVWGVEVTDHGPYETDPIYRDNYLTHYHMYNLTNQSWGVSRKNKDGVMINPIDGYFGALGKYPSSSEVVWTGLQFQAGSIATSPPTDPFERMYPNIYEESIGSDTKAPKGYFIIDFLDRGASRRSQASNNGSRYPAMAEKAQQFVNTYTKSDSNTEGASCIADFSGRIFYAGFNGAVVGGDARSPHISSFVLFSQLVKNVKDLSKCYQEGDPTSRDNSDIIDTDGGFIRISGAERILALVALEAHLVVVANNGIWAITGGADYGFSASNYKVSKISSFGCVSRKSIVVEGGRLFFWAEDGITAVGKDQFGELSLTSITQKSIQRFYDAIPATSKTYATGVYDQYSKKIRWLYHLGTPFTTSYKTKELILDLPLGSFYQSTVNGVPSGTHVIAGVFKTNPYTSSIRPDKTDSVKYYVVIKEGGTIRVTFSHYNAIDFYDWKSIDGIGVDSKAYLLTGAQTVGDSSVEKQVPYIVMHFKRTEIKLAGATSPERLSSCKVQSRWEWSNSVNSGKWSEPFQAYRHTKALFLNPSQEGYSSGFDLVTTKNKVRGRGKSISMYLETEPGKDCRVVGWNLTINGNALA